MTCNNPGAVILEQLQHYTSCLLCVHTAIAAAASMYNAASQLCLLRFYRLQQSDHSVFMLLVALQQHLPLEVDDTALSGCFQSAHESFKVVLALFIVEQHAISYSDCDVTARAVTSR
eukprot:14276-Heterococcus_DN1.PRE.1